MGVVPEALSLQNSVVLKKNDRLLMYTDGLFETTSFRNEPFGMQRLLQILDEYGNEPLEVLCDLIIEKSHEHANGNRGS